jgi:hypothetical protein
LKEGNNNLYATLKDWCQRALDLAKFIDVFYEGKGTIYDDILKDEKINKAVQDILAEVEWMAKKCNKYKDDNFSKYSKVWTQSQQTFINGILHKAEGLSERDKLTGQQVWRKPELEHFGKQIGSYRKSQNDIRLIRDSHSFEWLRVDCRRLKQSLDLHLGK